MSNPGTEITTIDYIPNDVIEKIFKYLQIDDLIQVAKSSTNNSAISLHVLKTRILKGHSNAVISVAFSPDGKTLATGSSDNTARVWDLASRQCSATLQGHTSCVRSVAFSSPDRNTLATGSNDKTARVWNLASGKCTATLQGHSDTVFSVAFSPDGKTLATGSKDNTARVWLV